MHLPEFVPEIADDVRREVQTKLVEIEARHDVRILFAVESGSRAWGFPSPDSDYDVRFVYAHKPDWYLSLKPGRDVIELPISDELDVAGWDARKALNLLLKPNPVLLEWLSSPVRYHWCEADCAELEALARRVAHGAACRHHYLHLGEGQLNKYIGENAEVNYKKYFYILRPALALRWLRFHPELQPPMNLQALLARLDLSADVIAEISRLLDLKSKAKEMGSGKRIPLVDELILDEFRLAKAPHPRVARRVLGAEADALFRRLLKDPRP
jgi:uncharacterized protein